jgi:ABC-2 type transport system permease protein
MSGWMPWKIARKELKVVRRKKSIIYYTILFPLVISVGFSFLVKSVVAPSSGLVSDYALGLDSIIFIFVVLAAILPASIAAYSIIGEKTEKSLEPLLATPATDTEILLGKGIAAFLLPIFAIWGAASVFMAAADYITYGLLSYDFFPNLSSGVILLILAPLAAIFSVELAVIASSRVSDVRGANQIASLMFIPFMGFFLAGTEGIVAFDAETLLIVSAVVLVADVALFFLSRSTFNREEILTKWK